MALAGLQGIVALSGPERCRVLLEPVCGGGANISPNRQPSHRGVAAASYALNA